MNKPIPEGGRSVKCARCGHQWRLAPENAFEETELLGEEADTQDTAGAEPQDPFDRAADYVRQARGGGAGAAAPSTAEPDMEQQATEWLARRDHHAAAISTLSQPDIGGYDPAAVPSEPEPDVESHDFEAHAEGEAEPDAAEAEAEAEDEAQPASSGESWWQRFRANARSAEPAPRPAPERFSAPQAADEEDEPADEPDQPEAAAQPVAEAQGFEADDGENEIKWPEFSAKAWRESSSPVPDVSEPDFEEAEAEIREALRSALEQPVEPAAPAFSKADEQAIRGDGGWRSRWDLGSADQPDSAAPQEPLRTAPTERFSFGSNFGADPDADADREEDEDENEAPFRLSGAHAKFPVYGARLQEEEDEADEDAAPHDAGFDSDIEGAFRANPLPKRPAMADNGHFDDQEPIPDFGSTFDERFARGDEDTELVDDFDMDAAALQARLESTDLEAYQQTRSYGGLAIAAAWAVFFSIVSGIALAFVSFRQDIMASLPGTRSLYHTLGFAVADNSVDFSDVSYRWTTVEGKPMIEVTGQVVNVSDNTVKVPRVLINVRDGARRDPVTATASVQAELLPPRASTNFSLEFVSPSKDINQIELEFDHRR
jgi:hypothetical protein